MDKIDKSVYYYQPLPGEIVINLGACRGGSVLEWAKMMNYKGLIIAVEAEPENYQILINNMSEEQRNFNIIIPICVAIWNITGEAKLTYATGFVSHSLAPEKVNNFQSRGIEKMIPTMTWDTLVEKFNLAKVDFCGCNIEGAEIEFLEGMNKVFPRRIEIETHSETLKREVIIKLKGKNYHLKQRGNIIIAEITTC